MAAALPSVTVVVAGFAIGVAAVNAKCFFILIPELLRQSFLAALLHMQGIHS